MKKKIIAVLLSFVLFAGCTTYEFRSESARIQSEYNEVAQQSHITVNSFEDYKKRERAFLQTLTDEQLRAYGECDTVERTENEASVILKLRKLYSLLSEEQWQVYLALLTEKEDLRLEVDNLISQEKELKREWKTQQEVDLYNYQLSQQRQAQYQKMWQDYYRQQQMQQSLNGIQNAITNLNRR